MIVNPGVQTVVAVPVDPVVTAVRGNSNMVRSDIPPVQSGEGVKYTRGRPSDDEDVQVVYSIKRKPPRDDGSHSDSADAEQQERHGRTREPEVAATDDEPLAPPAIATEEEALAASLDALPPEDTSIVAQMRQRHLPLAIGLVTDSAESSDARETAVRVIPGAVFSASYKPQEPDSSSLEILI